MTRSRTSRLAAVAVVTAFALAAPATAHADVVALDDQTVHLGGREVTVNVPDPGETTYYLDLSEYDDEVNTVYGSVPTPWGTMEYVVGAYNESDPEGGSGGSQSSHCPDPSTHNYDHYKQAVIGGGNPPTRSNADDTVYGSVYIHSCVEQDVIAKVYERVGGRVQRTSSSIVVRAPARAWISFGTPGLKCSDAETGDKGWTYSTWVETVADYGGRPVWQNESESRTWPGC